MKIRKLIIKPLAVVVGLVAVVFLVIAGMERIADLPKDGTVNIKGDHATTPLVVGVYFWIASSLFLEGMDEASVKWYRRAAEQGHAPSQYHLGTMYNSEWGIPQNYETAVKWFTRAAEQGYAVAQHNLGFMYDKGTGVPQDDVYAYMWYDIAASSGHRGASERDIIAKRMTPSQFEKAQDLARECYRKKYKGC